MIKFSDFVCSKSSVPPCFAFFTKKLITCMTPTRHEIFCLTAYGVMILDGLDLKCAHQKLGIVPT